MDGEDDDDAAAAPLMPAPPPRLRLGKACDAKSFQGSLLLFNDNNDDDDMVTQLCVSIGSHCQKILRLSAMKQGSFVVGGSLSPWFVEAPRYFCAVVSDSGRKEDHSSQSLSCVKISHYLVSYFRKILPKARFVEPTKPPRVDPNTQSSFLPLLG